MSRIIIAVAFCLVLAGCAAPAAQQTPAAGSDVSNASVEAPDNASESPNSGESATPARNAEDGYDVPVSGGSLPVDHERAFARTAALLGTNASPPTVVVVKSPDEIGGLNDDGSTGPPTDRSANRSFVGVVGIGQDDSSGADGEDGEGDGEVGGSDDGEDGGNGDGEDAEGDENDGSDAGGVTVAAYTPSAYSVVVNERMTASGRERALERTMVHEFVHTIQFREDAFARVQRALALRRPVARDEYLTYVGVVEGAAVYAAGEYDSRYLSGRSASIDSERYRSARSGVQLSLARYYFGGRYVRQRLDSPRNLSSVYDDPPRTTEQLLHGDAPDEEMPRPLSVSTTLDRNWSVGHHDTNGELFTRIALGTELNASHAERAAAGWGADELVPVERESQNRSFVWATRWDSAADADEFKAALGEYLAARGNLSGETWRDGSLAFRAVRTSEESVVLLAGENSFVRNASVSGTNASVSVALHQDSTT